MMSENNKIVIKSNCKELFLRIAAFVVFTLFVCLFMMQNNRKLLHSEVCECSFQSVTQTQYDVKFPVMKTHPAEIVLIPVAKPGKAMKQGSFCIQLLDPMGKILDRSPDIPFCEFNSYIREKWCFNIPENDDPGDLSIVVRRTLSGTPETGSFLLQVSFYGNILSKAMYYYGIILAALFFLFLYLAEKNQPLLPQKKRSASFDQGIHYFRAFAILCVMLVHYRYHSERMHVNVTNFL